MKILEFIRDPKINEKITTVLTVFLITSFYIFDRIGTYFFIGATLGLLVVYLLGHNKIYKLWKDPFIILFFLFCLYSLITSQWAIDHSLAFSMGMSNFKKLFMFSILYLNFVEKKDINRLLNPIVWSTGIVSVVSILDEGFFQMIINIIKGRRSDILFTNINDLGLLMAIGLIIIVFQFLFYKKKSKLNIFIALTSLLLLLETGSRKAMIITALGFMMLLFARTIGKDFKTTLKNWSKIFLIFVAVFLVLMMLPMFRMFRERMIDLVHLLIGSGHVDGGDVYRKAMIEAGIIQFKKTPILGIGFGCTGYLSTLVSSTMSWKYLHNNYIELLAGGGLIAFTLFYSMYAYVIYWFIKDLKNKNPLTYLCLILVSCNLIEHFAAVDYDSMITYVYLIIYFIQVENIKYRLNYNYQDGKLYKLFKFATSSDFRFRVYSQRGRYDDMDDKEFVERKFKAITGHKLDLEHPKTFNEKLQWLKLYNRKPEYTMMVDKYKVREYVANIIGEEHLIPLIGVWDKAEDINFDELPNQFVLKCNHNSGLGMCICKDKSQLDIAKVKEELNKGLAQNYYLTNREWPYKDVERKIICEKYVIDEKDGELKDYKFYCFGGEMKFVMINSGRFSDEETTGDYFTKDYQALDFEWGFKRSEILPEKPQRFEEMVAIAEKLSKDLIHARIDLYLANDQIYFGEITFFDGSGLDAINPYEWDEKIGSYIKLPID